ncbi:hypothetical protein P7C70_g7103, partial [Phenoliferia sp. Uapishka_3]
MFGFGTIIDVVSGVSQLFALDQSLVAVISTATSTVSHISGAFHKIDDDAAAVSSFFDVDVPTSQRRRATAAKQSPRSAQPSSHTSNTTDEDAAAVSSFFDVDASTSDRRRAANATPRTRRSSRRSSPSSTAASSPKIVVDTSFLDPLSSDHGDALSGSPRVPQWAQDLPSSATQLQPYYFQCLPKIEVAMKKRAARKERKERVRV